MYTCLDVFLWDTTRSLNTLKHSYSIVYSLKPYKLIWFFKFFIDDQLCFMSEWYSKYTSLELHILNFACVNGWIS